MYYKNIQGVFVSIVAHAKGAADCPYCHLTIFFYILSLTLRPASDKSFILGKQKEIVQTFLSFPVNVMADVPPIEMPLVASA